MSEKMKNIPKLRFPEFENAPEWEEIPLGHIGKVSMCKRVFNNETSPTGEIPFYKIGTFGKKADAYISRKHFEEYQSKYSFPKKGEILISAAGTIGRLVVYDGLPAYFQDSNIVWIENNEKIIKNYFLFFCYQNIKWTTEDTTIARLYNDNLKSIKISIPPLPEQQKIADCLSSLDELITAQAQKVEALKTHKKALMQRLFPREGESVPRLRFPEFQNAPEWEEKPLGKIGDVITGNTPNTSISDYYGGDKLFVSPADISSSRYILTTKTTLTELGFSETRQIKENSILFVCIGSTIGKVAQNKYTCATNQQINSIIPFAEYSNDFIYSSLENNSSQIALLAGNHAVPIINKTLFSSVKILVPKLPEQQKIADCLSSLDELITAQAQKVEALKTHKKALMQQLFPSDKER